MEKNQGIIIALLLIIIVLLTAMIVVMSHNTTDEKVEAANDTAVNETTVKESESDSDAPETITVELTEFDTEVSKTAGEYTVKAQKWRGSSAGGFQVSLSKNGQQMDRYSYQSRAYFDDGSGWKWSNWDAGEVDGATLHKYPVSNDVQIQKVEVRF